MGTTAMEMQNGAMLLAALLVVSAVAFDAPADSIHPEDVPSDYTRFLSHFNRITSSNKNVGTMHDIIALLPDEALGESNHNSGGPVHGGSTETEGLENLANGQDWGAEWDDAGPKAGEDRHPKEKPGYSDNDPKEVWNKVDHLDLKNGAGRSDNKAADNKANSETMLGEGELLGETQEMLMNEDQSMWAQVLAMHQQAEADEAAGRKNEVTKDTFKEMMGRNRVQNDRMQGLLGEANPTDQDTERWVKMHHTAMHHEAMAHNQDPEKQVKFQQGREERLARDTKSKHDQRQAMGKKIRMAQKTEQLNIKNNLNLGN